MRFNDFCIQANYRDLTKDENTDQEDYFKSPQLEIAALRSSMPDEALTVIQYTIEPQIDAGDRNKPWIWMKKLRQHYTGTEATSIMRNRFEFWALSQAQSEMVQQWENKCRQASDSVITKPRQTRCAEINSYSASPIAS